jgi:Phytanoyl-CoA dioxygenase (PhyH)
MSDKAFPTPASDSILDALERDGIVALPPMLDADSLTGLQDSFERVLEQPAFNTWYGFEQNEKWRLLVENALTVDPAIVRLALHPLLKSVLRNYIGSGFALTEARGWRTIRTSAEFHGWHNDGWYDESAIDPSVRPREVKLAMYLTDVESGHFSYIPGSHRPAGKARHWSPREVEPMLAQRRDILGRAGSAFLFDTAGIHRQTTPVLKPRNVLFLNYHDPSVRIQELDRRHGRYRPLLLNAAFLPPMDDEDRRILGFGAVKGRSAPGCVVGRSQVRRYPVLHGAVSLALAARLEVQELQRKGRRIVDGVARRLPSGSRGREAAAAGAVKL